MGWWVFGHGLRGWGEGLPFVPTAQESWREVLRAGGGPVGDHGDRKGPHGLDFCGREADAARGSGDGVEFDEFPSGFRAGVEASLENWGGG